MKTTLDIASVVFDRLNYILHAYSIDKLPDVMIKLKQQFKMPKAIATRDMILHDILQSVILFNLKIISFISSIFRERFYVVLLLALCA